MFSNDYICQKIIKYLNILQYSSLTAMQVFDSLLSQAANCIHIIFGLEDNTLAFSPEILFVVVMKR